MSQTMPPEPPTAQQLDDLLHTPASEITTSGIPGSPQPRGFLPLFVLSWFGISLLAGSVVGSAIPKVFAFMDDDSKAFNLSVVSAVGGIAVMIITPLFGRLSDRTMSRLGLRRPWILGGAVVGSAGLVMLAFSNSLLTVALGWVVAQIGYGATNAAIHALLADQIPTRIRARVSAAVSATGAVALIMGALIVAALPNDAQWSWFIVPGALAFVFSSALFFRLRDIVRTEKPAPWSWSDVVSTYWLDPVVYRDFFWAWACRLLVTMSIVSVTTYLLFFIIDRLGVPKEQASGILATVLTVFTAGSIGTTIFFGWLSDRIGRRKPIVWVSAMLSALGLVVAVIAPDLSTFLIAMVIVGAAQGAFVSVDVALMTEVLPTYKDAGKDMGIVSLSYQLPQVLVPIAAVPLLAIGGGGANYTALFIAAIVFGLAGALAVLPIKGVK